VFDFIQVDAVYGFSKGNLCRLGKTL